MMTFSPINDQVYDTSATQITYCKLFPLMLEDFVTRIDAKQMMDVGNLPVTTSVVVKPGQAVQVAYPAGTGSTVSPASVDCTGNTKPIYNGSTKLPGDEALAKQKQAIKNAGGQATQGVLNTALGG
jgi:hypothetical protein